MCRSKRQFGALVVLIALTASASSQTAAYTVPAASVRDDFSSYHQALSNAADMALANAAREADVSSQFASVATKDTTQPDAAVLQHFAQKYWNGAARCIQHGPALGQV